MKYYKKFGVDIKFRLFNKTNDIDNIYYVTVNKLYIYLIAAINNLYSEIYKLKILQTTCNLSTKSFINNIINNTLSNIVDVLNITKKALSRRVTDNI